MPRSKDDEKRARIMGQAKRLFARPGREDATLKGLAALSDITPSSLYTYFNSVDEVIKAVVEDSWEWLGDKLSEDAAAGGEPKQRLERFLGAYMPELIADSNLCSLIVRFPHFIQKADAKLDGFADILGPGLEALGERYGSLSMNRQGRKAQSLILVLGALCAVYFAENSDLDLTAKDILNAFRAFLKAD
jgi:AcrR family transcriptional regulator